MKEQKRKIAISIMLIIIILGIVMVSLKGFKADLKYQETKKIEINLGKKFKNNDIKEIAEDILKQKTIIQKIEIYEDAVSITSKEINDEQKTQIVNKINEKYQTQIKPEEIIINKIPKAHLRDLIKPYILPFAISTIIILAYILTRYYKLTLKKVLSKTLLTIIIPQIILFSLIAILRIEIGMITISEVSFVYMLSLINITRKFEEELEEKRKIELEKEQQK